MGFGTHVSHALLVYQPFYYSKVFISKIKFESKINILNSTKSLQYDACNASKAVDIIIL